MKSFLKAVTAVALCVAVTAAFCVLLDRALRIEESLAVARLEETLPLPMREAVIGNLGRE